MGYLDGTRIFVPFTIPGEHVRAVVHRQQQGDAWATLESVLRASPHRVAPRCRHFGPPDRCGGCSWQHIDYAEQLRLKSDLVRRLVTAAMRGRAPHVAPTLPSTTLDAPWGYRHKAHFVFANGDQGLIMGHYARGSRHVFHALECPVHDPRGNLFAFSLHAECAGAGVNAAALLNARRSAQRRSAQRHPAQRRRAGAPTGTLRHLAVRCGVGTRETMATLVVTSADDRRLRDAALRAVLGPAGPSSFHLNLHEGDDPYIFGPETRHVRGARHLRERVAGTTFLISPTAFFQTNVRAAEILVRLVLEAVPDDATVLDLYAGVGLFALPLARRGNTVIAIEENRAATAAGRASVKLNRIPEQRCRFVTGRVADTLRGRRTGASHVVLDPPRGGCERGVIHEVFGRMRPNRAVYVSCNPEALADDLAEIDRYGYLIERLQPVDMFPHTAHVETVAVLTRTRGDESRRP